MVFGAAVSMANADRKKLTLGVVNDEEAVFLYSY